MAVTLGGQGEILQIGPGQPLLNELLLRGLAGARAEAEAEGISVSDDELEEALSGSFSEVDAFEEPQIASWMAARRLSRDAVKEWVRGSLLGRKLRDHLVPDDVVEKRFHTSLHDYARIAAEVIEFESAGVASEVLLQLREQETTWPQAVEQAGWSSGARRRGSGGR